VGEQATSGPQVGTQVRIEAEREEEAMTRDTSWWCISGEQLIAALRQVAAGDDPNVVYLELLANSQSEEQEEH